MDIPIIAITGTKGKTTTTYMVAEVLQALGHNVLRVDTTGHYLNGEQKSTLSESKRLWGLVPTIAPGRYLWEFQARPEMRQNGVAVLESSLGCSTISGMAYRVHKVGVFLNVFEDHLGSSERLKVQADIAEAKDFVFSRLERDGWAVFNADDPLVVSRLTVVPDHLQINLLACGLDFKHFDLDGHLQSGGEALSVVEGAVVLLSKSGSQVLVDLKRIPWTFDAKFKPSVWNILLAVASVYALHEGKWSPKISRAFEAVRLDQYGGRLTLLQAANGAVVLADYAHEKISLTEVAKLARGLTKQNGQVIGVLRLAVDRTDELIRETGQAIAGLYDTCIIFDKIDGYLRQPKQLRSKRFTERVGYVSQVFADAISETNPKVERILREDKAIQRAAELAGPNDVVVYIVNDDVKRSIDFAREAFQAVFI